MGKREGGGAEGGMEGGRLGGGGELKGVSCGGGGRGTETIRGSQDGRLDSHTAPELLSSSFNVALRPLETIRTIRGGEPRTATSTFTQFLSSLWRQTARMSLTVRYTPRLLSGVFLLGGRMP